MSVNPEDLIDRQEVADLIGLSSPDGLSVYRKRYEDFPVPVIEKGRTVLWLRQDVEAWETKRRRRTTWGNGG